MFGFQPTFRERFYLFSKRPRSFSNAFGGHVNRYSDLVFSKIFKFIFCLMFYAVWSKKTLFRVILSYCVLHSHSSDALEPTKRVEVIIVGAGAAGLSAAHKLLRGGLSDILIVEASSEIGGRVKKLTGFVDYPLDLGASLVPYDKLNYFTKYTDDQTLPLKFFRSDHVYNMNNYAWNNYTYWDFLNDYVAPSRKHISFNCEVEGIRFYKEDEINKDNYMNDDMEVSCHDGRSFLASRAVVVTVPLSILNDGDIYFSRHFGTLPGKVSGKPERSWWKGFKLFIEFEQKFWIQIVDAIDDREGLNYDGDHLFWDLNHFSAPSDSSPMYPILAMYFSGYLAEPFLKMSEYEIVDETLMLLSNHFNKRVVDLQYRRHFLKNWSKEPLIRGLYSGYAYDNITYDINNDGAVNFRDKLFFAGEAFPVFGEQGWVYSALDSGNDAAMQILGIC